MKHNWKILRQYLIWLLLLVSIDGFAAVLLWLADIRAFRAMLAAIILMSLLLFTLVSLVLVYHENRKEEAFRRFLHEPNEYQEEKLAKMCGEADREMVRLLGVTLRAADDRNRQLTAQAGDYREYVETWAHETKTPLALLTMLIDNHRQELPQQIGIRLDIVRNRMQESVSQMLFYARLNGTHNDYLFEQLSLADCIGEVLEDYRPLIEERDITVKVSCEARVYSDRRGLLFVLSQIISNAIKYSVPGEAGRIECVCTEQEQSLEPHSKKLILCVRDYGRGVRACDLPYIFEKGFTGDSEDGRRAATGMGLYLAREAAHGLNIALEAESAWGEGMLMKVSFPQVDQSGS